ncbi:MAG: hypothetical protein M3Y07_14560 [Acidobacteriota bacterium]|nr:hypothetical protein [Acidobacteriota bacterium]
MRFAFFIIRLLVIFGILRYLIGFLVKFVGSTMRPVSRAVHFPEPRAPERRGRELRKDPVCGTFIPIDSSLHKTVNGEVMYFCSVDCRDRFKAA